MATQDDYGLLRALDAFEGSSCPLETAAVIRRGTGFYATPARMAFGSQCLLSARRHWFESSSPETTNSSPEKNVALAQTTRQTCWQEASHRDAHRMIDFREKSN
ncbi:unnamed protein product [Protopolystoma xenopodis]|uniref:Uncharacterized protein n=1 Tax=Protopolystoma xenopodis TaxID=117903 RepID=A0A3S5BD68_9PLAT|nr:unnamed protein product [Protopolystoma xenopodis]